MTALVCAELMLRKRIPVDKAEPLDYDRYAACLDGYSGSDITLLCKEAVMRPVRRLMDKLEALEEARGMVYFDMRLCMTVEIVRVMRVMRVCYEW